ncbi:hypothetical protein D3C71_1163550 [compost metagenome]
MITSKASSALPPYLTGSVSGPIASINSKGDPGHPCVRIRGKAPFSFERTWINCMSSPSILVTNCGSAFSLFSSLRQS